MRLSPPCLMQIPRYPAPAICLSVVVALASIAAEPAKTPAGASLPLAQAKPQLVAYLTQPKKQAEIEKLLRDIREKAEVK